MKSKKMNTMVLENGRVTKTGSSVILAIGLHVTVIFAFMFNIQRDEVDNLFPPPSVVMELSLESEAKQLTELNIGQTQELSTASQAQESQVEESLMPTAPINEQAEILIAKTEKKKLKPETKKEMKETKNHRTKEIESDNSKASSAPVTSDAAAPKQSQRVAAQVNNSSQSESDMQRQWEALVLGELNKFKRYPDDARRRNRTGRPVVKFNVDAQGNVLDSIVIKNSGTQSLDREAQKVLSRAEPLPPPPSEMLVNGRVTVQIPIDFAIERD